MNNEIESDAEPLTNETRGQLKGLSKSLLRLHKTLLDYERADYEQAHGRVPSSGEMFRLVLNDPFFAWLRVFSGLIVEVDEFLASKQPTTERAGGELLKQVRGVLSFENADEEFGGKYQNALQNHAEVVLNHNEALKFTK